MSDDAIETPPEELTGWKAAFVAALRESPNVSAAAKAAGMNRQYVYEARGADPLFAVAWDDALEEAVDELEAAMFLSATVLGADGRKRIITPVQAGLALTLLKAHRASKYRDKVSTEHSGEVKVLVEYESSDPPYAHLAPPGAEEAG